MHIVIVGVGKIGSIICKELADEHEVVVIEQDADKLESFINTTDVTGIAASGTDVGALTSAGTADCDVFIAVTAEDEINIISCIFAKQLGARYTIARIREHGYTAHQAFIKESIGIDAIINPERESARQITSLLRFPATTRVESFVRGKVNIIEYPLPEGHPFVGQTLIQFQEQFKEHILVCIVERGGRAIIPKGDFLLEAGDIIHVSGTSAELMRFFRLDGQGNDHRRIKTVMIIGAGRLTHYLLREIENGSIRYRIKVLENNRHAAETLARLHPDVDVVFADGSNYHHLEEEGVANYDCLIALTGIDEENILICMYAHKRGLHDYIAKVNRTQLLEILGEDRLKAVITPGSIIADTILRLIRAVIDTRGKDVEALYRLAEGQVEALQFRVPEDSLIIGKRLMDLPIKPNILIAAAITKDGERLAPSGRTIFHAGDMIIVTTTDHSLRSIDDILVKKV